MLPLLLGARSIKWHIFFFWNGGDGKYIHPPKNNKGVGGREFLRYQITSFV